MVVGYYKHSLLLFHISSRGVRWFMCVIYMGRRLPPSSVLARLAHAQYSMMGQLDGPLRILKQPQGNAQFTLRALLPGSIVHWMIIE